MNTQGERIKKLRQELNLSQDEFGKIFSIQKQMVSSLENDKLKLNNEKLALLCESYNVNINWLLCGIGEMFNTQQSPSAIDKDEVIKIVEDYLIKRDSELNR